MSDIVQKTISLYIVTCSKFWTAITYAKKI